MRLLYTLLFTFILTLGSAPARAGEDAGVLAEINLARTRPHEYAALLEARMRAIAGTRDSSVGEAAAFLRRQEPLPPLQSEPGLMASARQHAQEQGPLGATGHRGSDGSSPWARMARWGHFIGRAGENISYGYSDARGIVATLIVDQGVPDRGHRRNLFSRAYHVAGVACGPHARYRAMCVMDFAGGFATDRLAATETWGG